ncbi:MAG: ribonuclease H-like domain-containing protein [Lachnospiraceae bacterium]|nr:ribonuclease H-like domain-containing protein [Lachnospiraceae bacterium]
MIRVNLEPELPIEYFPERFKDPEKVLFFDIETTGLSASDSAVYLIGCLYYREGCWHFSQFLTESLSDELPVLKAFFQLAEAFDTLVHFNGDAFDIRFLNTAAAQYHLPSPLSDMQSIDLLKKVRKHRKLLGLENCRLKTVEQFLGIYREDIYSGKDLIEIYQTFSRTRSERLKELLLLHNREDILNMIGLLPVLRYADVTEAPRELLSPSEIYLNRSGTALNIRLSSKEVFPVPVSAVCGNNVRIDFDENEVLFKIPVMIGTLKYFYPDYKNYWYLPGEDYAIHKKLARYVDKDHRLPATRETCYTRVESLFALKPDAFEAPVFKTAWNARENYVELTEDSAFVYACKILESL